MSDAQPNHDQAVLWNEKSGPRWVAMAKDLDAQLEPFGVAVANRLQLTSGEHVLDVGCGAGATSLMLAARVRPGQVVGVDISAPLLARARERALGVDHVRFELADAQTFPFANASYDAIFSRFGVMFFADPVAAFVNLRRGLRPGGRMGFVCWRAMSENPSFVIPLEAGLPFLPEPPKPPEPNAPGPFAFAEERRIAEVLERAGYVDIDIVSHDSEMVFAGRSDVEAAVDLALQVGPLSRALPALAEVDLAAIRAALRAAFLPHHRARGVTLPAATWIVSARGPS